MIHLLTCSWLLNLLVHRIIISCYYSSNDLLQTFFIYWKISSDLNSFIHLLHKCYNIYSFVIHKVHYLSTISTALIIKTLLINPFILSFISIIFNQFIHELFILIHPFILQTEQIYMNLEIEIVLITFDFCKISQVF